MHEHRHRWALAICALLAQKGAPNPIIWSDAQLADVIDQDPLQGPRIQGRAALGGQSVLVV